MRIMTAHRRHVASFNFYGKDYPMQKLLVMSVAPIVVAAGYDGAYEFEATSSAGVRTKGHAHPATGRVLPRGLLCCDTCLET